MMKRSLLAALAATALAAPAFAQRAPTTEQVGKARDAALKDDLAYDIVEGITTEVGQRLAGTEAEARLPARQQQGRRKLRLEVHVRQPPLPHDSEEESR